VLQPDHRQPGFQRAFRVGMGLPKLLQPLPRNNVHLSLFWTYGEEDDCVSRLLFQRIEYKRLPLRVSMDPNTGNQQKQRQANRVTQVMAFGIVTLQVCGRKG
jgi:hypothetical protein